MTVCKYVLTIRFDRELRGVLSTHGPQCQPPLAVTMKSN